jgi:hypothetical protein
MIAVLRGRGGAGGLPNLANRICYLSNRAIDRFRHVILSNSVTLLSNRAKSPVSFERAKEIYGTRQFDQ